MKIVVFGAGAIGSLVGGLLSRRHEVTLIGRPAQMQAIEESGLAVSGVVEAVFVPKTSEDVSVVGQADMVVMAVKSPSLRPAMEMVQPLLRSETILVTLQNGLRQLDVLRDLHPTGVVGVTGMGANLSGPGRIVYAGEGETYLGSLDGDIQRARIVAHAFYEVGMDAEAREDIVPEVWMKAIVNAAANPLTAILRCHNEGLLKSDGLMSICEAVCNEGKSAAIANGIEIPDDPYSRLRLILKKTGQNKSSMLQDVEKGRRTEIDDITGALVLLGEREGVMMPVNRVLWQLVNALGGC